ncbi:spore cortex-lytic enzyme [Sporolactobacillus vineae]|uniref:spore cortex-lytic enzyme n=1 Tax=Sporolactobacillus vineae TaxID=444463 RepID=UPI00028A194F|nr:spore cortex-lytic enzyme [Sporolactobacillus vineae]
MFKRLLYLFAAIVLVCLIEAAAPDEVSAFSGQVIVRGATGDDVIELQARLQYCGYFKGRIDGIFGYGTYWALRDFQEKFGLKVDGQAGSATRQKLIRASQFDRNYVYQKLQEGKPFTYYGHAGRTSSDQKTDSGIPKGKAPAAQSQGKPAKSKYTIDNLPQGYSKADINLMANAVYGESRGEPYIGQVAVSSVIINRVADPRFPNTISDVIFQPGAFTAVSDGQIWLTPNETARRAVMDAINGWDPSQGALYYFNPDTATSAWIWSRPQIQKIGKHIFCK